MPALELVNIFIPENALVLIVLSDAPLGVSQLLRSLGMHLLSSLLPLRRRKVKRRRLALVPGTPTTSRIIIGKLSHRIAPLQFPAAFSSSAPEGRTHSMS